MHTDLSTEEYTALKQILKDAVEREFIPAEICASYIAGVFKPVDLSQVDPDEVFTLRKNAYSTEYYGSGTQNMAIKMNHLTPQQRLEVQDQLLGSVIKTWSGPVQFDLMSAVVDSVGRMDPQSPDFEKTHTIIFDAYLNHLKSGVGSEKDIKEAWGGFIEAYAHKAHLKSGVLHVINHVAPTMLNNFDWWEASTFKDGGIKLSDLSALQQHSNMQGQAFEALGLSALDRIRATVPTSSMAEPQQDTLDFTI